MAENYPIYGSNMDIPGHKLTISWTIYLIEGYMKTHFNKNIKSQRQEKKCFLSVLVFYLFILNSYNLEFHINFFNINFYWSTVVLQYCVSFCYPGK